MIEWKPEFEVGIKSIDVHHKVLVRTFNEFEASLETDAVSRRTLQEILLFLQHYASWHFSREEEVAECYHCPIAPVNKRAHEKFIHRFSKMYAEFRTLPDEPDSLKSFAQRLHHELSQWLVSHVLNVDQQIGACVHQQRWGEMS